jgi:CBS-domain-containing membrane protein
LLFSSLASSAFLIYLDPESSMNNVRTLALAQIGAAAIGVICYLLIGSGYLSGGTAMVLSIGGMIVLNAMHPPAVSTALSFALRAGDESSLALFVMAVGITVVLIVLQRSALWMLRRANRGRP